MGSPLFQFPALRRFGIAAGALGIALGAVSIYGISRRHGGEAPPPPPASGTPYQPGFSYRPVPGYRVGLPMRPMDIDIFEAIERGRVDAKAKEDLFPGRPYRVRLL